MIRYTIDGLTCGGCALNAQKILLASPDVSEAVVNLATRTASIRSELSLDALNTLFAGSNFSLQAQAATAPTPSPKPKVKKELLTMALLSLALFICNFFQAKAPVLAYVQWGLATILIGGFGRSFFSAAFRQIKRFQSNMDSLIALGAGSAYLLSVLFILLPDYWAQLDIQTSLHFTTAGMLIFFIRFGKQLEEQARSNSNNALQSLFELQVPLAQKINADGSETAIKTADIKKGDLLKVRPGEQIPADGFIVEGEAKIDESMLTGEALPRTKSKMDTVFAGTINQLGTLSLEVQTDSQKTVLAQIIEAVEQAQNSKIPAQRMADKLAAIFVPLVVLLSLFTAAYWSMQGAPAIAINTALTVLLIACPCALGLATPIVSYIAIQKAAQRGIIIRDAAALEKAEKIDTILLDKTGTITEGAPKIVGIHWQHFLLFQARVLEKVLLALESESQHPIAKTFTQAFNRQGMKPEHKVEQFINIDGLGISGLINEKQYWVGSRQLLAQKGIAIAEDIQKAAAEFEEKAYTLAFFANDQTALAVIAFSDAIKPSSKTAVQALQKAGIRVEMLTGDHETIAAYTARQLGIKQYQANCLPKDKLARIRQLQAEGKQVMMVGDGINDAPALAQANIGIAMNQGTQIAIENADLVLRHNNLEQLLDSIKIAQRLRRTIRQNLFWAFGYNILGLPLAAGVLYPFTGYFFPPAFAGAAMAFSSLAVVLNSQKMHKI